MKLIVILLALFEFTSAQHSQDAFSGVYRPNTKYSLESYAGAWLMSTEHFLTKKERIDRISFLEMTTTALVDPSRVFMTRDYFDFQVEHYSSTSNNIMTHEIDVFYTEITMAKAQIANHMASNVRRNADFDFQETTVAIIPFSVVGAIRGPVNKLREAYFRLTFWSVYRYFNNIAVSVTNNRDYKALEEMQLPYFEIFNSTPPSTQAWENPKMSLKIAHQKLSFDPSWKKFHFIYFSESDLILHMRSRHHLSKAFQKLGNNYVLVPHRMQTLPLARVVPPKYMKHFEKWKLDSEKNITLITERPVSPVGSCCDNGRYIFKDCGNWWYNCQQWGLINITKWIRFGKTGFTIPLTTEHKGRCMYHEKRTVCPIPKDCRQRIPSTEGELCRELPIIESNDPSHPSINEMI